MPALPRMPTPATKRNGFDHRGDEEPHLRLTCHTCRRLAGRCDGSMAMDVLSAVYVHVGVMVGPRRLASRIRTMLRGTKAGRRRSDRVPPRGCAGYAVIPPSIRKTAPVAYDDSSLARNSRA